MNINNFNNQYATNAGGLLYEIKDPSNGLRGYLYGTVHEISYQADRSHLLCEEVKQAVAKSDVLTFEVNMFDGIEKYGETIDSLIPQIKKRQLMAGREGELVVLGYEAKKEFVYLEDTQYHCEVERKLKMDMETNLQKKLDLIPDDKNLWTAEQAEYISKVNKFIEFGKIAHKCCDEKAIIDNFAMEVSPEIKKMALDDRDEGMGNKIHNLLLGDKKIYFNGLGVDHIPGIVRLLKEKGWTMNIVDLPVKKPSYQPRPRMDLQIKIQKAVDASKNQADNSYKMYALFAMAIAGIALGSMYVLSQK